MADPRFYRRAGPFRLADLAARADASLAGAADPARMIHDVATLEGGGVDDLAYYANSALAPAFAATKVGVCITTEAFAPKAPSSCAILIAKNPRAAFARIAAAFYPEIITTDSGPAPQVGEGSVIAPGAVIEPGAVIGKNTVIGSNTVIGRGVAVGDDCRIAANVTLAYCLVGNRVILHPGVKAGQDGFGFVPSPEGHAKVPQLGRVLIHDDVEIGANTTVDRGAMGDTVIGAGTKIDNLVQIGHNVTIGRNCIFAAQVGISGSCNIGDDVILSGQVGLAEHVTIGAGAIVAAQSGIMRDVPPGQTVMGSPAKPIRQFWREVAALTRLTNRDK